MSLNAEHLFYEELRRSNLFAVEMYKKVNHLLWENGLPYYLFISEEHYQAAISDIQSNRLDFSTRSKECEQLIISLENYLQAIKRSLNVMMLKPNEGQKTQMRRAGELLEALQSQYMRHYESDPSEEIVRGA
jgi:hypothetical protein